MDMRFDKTMGVPIPYILLAALFLIDIVVLQSLGFYAYSDAVRVSGWYVTGIQSLIIYLLWAFICLMFSQYAPAFSLRARTAGGKARVLWNSVVVAAAHRTLSTFLFFVYLRMFTDVGAREIFNRQVLWGYGLGVIESLMFFWIIISVVRRYRERQTEIYEIRRELSNTLLSPGGWQGAVRTDDSRDDPGPSRSWRGFEDLTTVPVPDRTIGSNGSNVRVEVASERSLMVRPRLVLNPQMGRFVDSRIVAPCFYEQFHTFLSREDAVRSRIIGITSPNPGEGTTTTAANLAVALTMGYEKKTVLIDLNLRRPSLHRVFDTAPRPGAIDALNNSGDGRIHVSATRIPGLFVLPAGSLHAERNGKAAGPSSHGKAPNGKPPAALSNGNGTPRPQEPTIGLGQATAFFEMLSVLGQEFECILVDMPPANTEDFPVLLSSRLDHVLAVVDAGKTRQKDIEKMFHQVNKDQFLGFVLNQVKNPDECAWPE